MPWLSLKRLMPPKNMWKVLRNKLQFKLHKLNRSKAIKKHKIRHHKTSKKLGWLYLSTRPKKFKLKPKAHTFITHQSLHKRPAPVYIDQLFIESGSTAKGPQIQRPVVVKEESVVSSRNRKESAGRGVMNDENNTDAADDMWESLVLGSPQMHGIDERADAFIAQFRADMHRQEMLARRL